MHPGEPDYSAIIRLGRAHVRLIEAAQLLLEHAVSAHERRRLERLLAHYQPVLRELLEELPPHVSAQILAASDKMLGTVQDVGMN